MTNFIVIFNTRTYPGAYNEDIYYENTSSHVELETIRQVELFINGRLRQQKWMRPTDFCVYSARRATITTGGKPVESPASISSRC